MKEIQTGFSEYPDWKKNDPMIGVTWNMTCQKCGFAAVNRPFRGNKPTSIEAEGRVLQSYETVLVIGGKRFTSEQSQILCNLCGGAS